MEKKRNSLEEDIKKNALKFLEISKDKEILIISHFDTDGISSATIIIKSLKKLDKKFSVKIIKSLDEQFIQELLKDKIIIFLDLASGSLHHIQNSNLKNVFIIDHHEISEEIPEDINIINPELNKKEKISASVLTYFFCKELDQSNKEYATNPYLPGITGNIKGVLELLREIGLNPEEGKYKSLIELNEEEMEKLIATIILKCPKSKEDIIGDIFLLKISNRLEDARELSAMINACSKFGESGTAIQTCMGIAQAKKKAEAIHVRYKQLILSGIKYAENAEKIIGKGFVIINAKEEIKDTMAGTITQDKEEEFLKILKKNLEIEVIKIQ